MTASQRISTVVISSVLFAASAAASELSYTFLDFQVVGHSIDAIGSQSPVAGQTVDVSAADGIGISISGSLAIGQHFYASGTFQSSIVDVTSVITNPLGVTDVEDEFDLIQSRLVLGYQRELGENFDLLFEVSFDSTDYDFGSFAGESFDADDTGYGAAVGFRWNPHPSFEVFAMSRLSSIGEVNLDLLEFDNDVLFNTGVRWYFFEDLGLSVDYEAGSVDTLRISMRFSFGNLPW